MVQPIEMNDTLEVPSSGYVMPWGRGAYLGDEFDFIVLFIFPPEFHFQTM